MCCFIYEATCETSNAHTWNNGTFRRYVNIWKGFSSWKCIELVIFCYCMYPILKTTIYYTELTKHTILCIGKPTTQVAGNFLNFDFFFLIVTTRPTLIENRICESLISLKSCVTSNFHHDFKLDLKLFGQSITLGFGVLQMPSEPILVLSGWWDKPHQGMISHWRGMFITS